MSREGRGKKEEAVYVGHAIEGDDMAKAEEGPHDAMKSNYAHQND